MSASGAPGCFPSVCTCRAPRRTKQSLPRGCSVPPKGLPRHLAGTREGHLPPRTGQDGEWEMEELLGEKVSQKWDSQSLRSVLSCVLNKQNSGAALGKNI